MVDTTFLKIKIKCNLKIIIFQPLKYMQTRTNIHKCNSLLQTKSDNVYIIASAFKNRIITYRLNPAQGVEYATPAFLCQNKNDILKVIDMSLVKNTCIKINFELFAYFVLPKTSEQQMKSFNTKYEIVCKM